MAATGDAMDSEYDVVVIGSGAGGLACAVSAAVHGLKAIVVEKEPLFGGTTAYSGGYLWVPGHPKNGLPPDPAEIEAARTYMRHEAGNAFDSDRTDAFLANGRAMVEFFEANTDVRFLDAPAFSDYHPDAPGARPGGRSILTAPIEGQALGEDIRRLRPPLSTITFVGMMFNSSQEVNHFFNVTRSARSAWHVFKRLAAHGRDLAFHRRGMRLTSGNALAARLAISARKFGVPILTSSPARRLVTRDGRVSGVEVETPTGLRTLVARRGVVLACGGFPQDPSRRKALFPHAPTGTEHVSPAPAGNTGDGLRLGADAGGSMTDDLPNAAAWIPVSKVPRAGGGYAVFPHLIDRYKPGVIAIGPDGRRFVNEANSYHDFGQAMIAAAGDGECRAWLVCDRRALRKYGLGFVKPFPLPVVHHLRSGYLVEGATPQELAAKAGFDGDAFARQIEAFNTDARRGEDTQFGKGETAYNRFLGDASHQPNPCVAPLQGKLYAIRLALGDLGTFAGLRTDATTRVLDGTGKPVPGLHAVGNDASSVMGGAYPGGGITLGPALTFGYIAGRELAASAGSRSGQ